MFLKSLHFSMAYAHGSHCVLMLVLYVSQVSSLKSRLKKVSTTTGDGVARAFLKSQVALFGSYRNALQIESVSTHYMNIRAIISQDQWALYIEDVE